MYEEKSEAQKAAYMKAEIEKLDREQAAADKARE
jgi:hypothetical protein